MKTRYTLTAAALVVASTAGNAHWGYHEYQAWKMEDACAQSFNVYGCHWVLQPVNRVESPTPPAPQASSVDPIGDMIKAAEARGLPVPPRAGRS